MKHTIKIADNKVICTARYMGSTVRGIAKCNSEYDAFDVEKGSKLSRLRCEVKLAKKRKKRAMKKFQEAQLQLIRATKYAKDMAEYKQFSIDELSKIEKELEEFEKSL